MGSLGRSIRSMSSKLDCSWLKSESAADFSAPAVVQVGSFSKLPSQCRDRTQACVIQRPVKLEIPIPLSIKVKPHQPSPPADKICVSVPPDRLPLNSEERNKILFEAMKHKMEQAKAKIRNTTLKIRGQLGRARNLHGQAFADNMALALDRISHAAPASLDHNFSQFVNSSPTAFGTFFSDRSCAPSYRYGHLLGMSVYPYGCLGRSITSSGMDANFEPPVATLSVIGSILSDGVALTCFSPGVVGSIPDVHFGRMYDVGLDMPNSNMEPPNARVIHSNEDSVLVASNGSGNHGDDESGGQGPNSSAWTDLRNFNILICGVDASVVTSVMTSSSTGSIFLLWSVGFAWVGFMCSLSAMRVKKWNVAKVLTKVGGASTVLGFTSALAVIVVKDCEWCL